MTSASSTAPVVLATIVANAKASTAFTGVQVLWGDMSDAERENLFFSGDVEYDTETWASLGARSREEKYVLDGMLWVIRPGDTVAVAQARAFELLAGLEALLRLLVKVPDAGMTAALTAAYGAGAAQIVNLEFVPKKGDALQGEEGKVYRIDFGIRVTARI